MVVYKSLVANLAPECLDALGDPGSGGAETEPKLVTLQLKLEKEYPEVIVTSSQIDESEEIQVIVCDFDV